MWPHPGMYFHGYPYGVPNNFHLGSMCGNFDQHHPVLPQIKEKGLNANKSSEKDVIVEVLEEGNSWTASREQRTVKQQKGVNCLCPKVNIGSPLISTLKRTRGFRFYTKPGAFLPLREIRKCVPEFFALNMTFLYLTGYNTEEEIKNSYR